MLDYGECSKSVHFQFEEPIGIVERSGPLQKRHWLEIRMHVEEIRIAGSVYTFMAKLREKRPSPGAELLVIRQQLGWSLREVHAASMALAKKHRQPAFVIAPSVLHRIETRNSTPSIHRLYALA